MSKPTYQIPFDKQGKLLSYPDREVEWKDNFTFGADIVYEGYGRGRSSAVIYMRDTYTQKVYPMFLTTFDDLMKSNRATIRPDGSIKFTGQWTFCKKGQNYALKMSS
jgi:hypothetical protein